MVGELVFMGEPGGKTSLSSTRSVSIRASSASGAVFFTLPEAVRLRDVLDAAVVFVCVNETRNDVSAAKINGKQQIDLVEMPPHLSPAVWRCFASLD